MKTSTNKKIVELKQQTKTKKIGFCNWGIPTFMKKEIKLPKSSK